MFDILLKPEGDLNITDDGDIQLTESVRQAIRIRLLWFFSEWRFAPDIGIPYFEEVFVKNPNMNRIRAHIRREVLSVRDVRDIRSLRIDLNASTRNAVVSFTAVTDRETYNEELSIPWPH